MAKKRSTSKERALRRELEILRAQIKSDTQNRPVISAQEANKSTAQISRQDLPVKHIKKELVKMIFFGAFALVVVILLGYFDVTFDDFRSFQLPF